MPRFKSEKADSIVFVCRSPMAYEPKFSDRTFEEFFKDEIGVEIFDQKYSFASGSKANRLRGFWKVEDDVLVGKSIETLLAYIDTQILLGNFTKEDFPEDLTKRARSIAERLRGFKTTAPVKTEDEFISKEFRELSIETIGLDSAINGILKQRIEEIRRCLTANAPLSVIFLCGSTLEGILLGIACTKAKEFNQSP